MMLNQLITNKKIITVVLALILALVVGIAILVTPNTEETGVDNPSTKTEQGKEETDFKDDKEDDSSELELLEPDEIAVEDSSDASGSWEKESGSDTQTGTSETTDDTDKTEDNTPEEDKKDEGDNPEKDQNILKDDISWGDIY